MASNSPLNRGRPLFPVPPVTATSQDYRLALRWPCPSQDYRFVPPHGLVPCRITGLRHRVVLHLAGLQVCANAWSWRLAGLQSCTTAWPCTLQDYKLAPPHGLEPCRIIGLRHRVALHHTGLQVCATTWPCASLSANLQFLS